MTTKRLDMVSLKWHFISVVFLSESHNARLNHEKNIRTIPTKEHTHPIVQLASTPLSCTGHQKQGKSENCHR